MIKNENVSRALIRRETAEKPSKRLPGVKHVIAVASGKGGVGKSTVAAGLAIALANEGCKVGVLDADIYGPSQPALFKTTGYRPAATGNEPDALIVPAQSRGVEIMSIGYFISPDDALIWRGPMAVNALRQLIRQTAWGELDFLVVDMPPGTGDVHLSLAGEVELDGAIVVTTAQGLALADVRRGVEMFRADGIGVPVLGVVENMSWFSPPDAPEKRYYIFGEGGAERFARELGLDFLGGIPIVADGLTAGPEGAILPEYTVLARRVVDKFNKEC